MAPSNNPETVAAIPWNVSNCIKMRLQHRGTYHLEVPSRSVKKDLPGLPTQSGPICWAITDTKNQEVKCIV